MPRGGARPQRRPAESLLPGDSNFIRMLQRQAGNQAVQRLLGDPVVAQRYRRKGAMNFGGADTGALVESNFTSTKKQPWISLISVNFNGVIVDAFGQNIPTGTATATYFSNAHALPAFSVGVAGGPRSMRSDPGSFTVHRIEGVGYNDPTAAADIAARLGAGALEGPKRGKHRRYTKPQVGQKPMDVAASMHLAVFYNRGEALHNGDLTVGSHGCVHIDDFPALTQLNYHSVIGRTKVQVTYSGLAKAAFTP